MSRAGHGGQRYVGGTLRAFSPASTATPAGCGVFNELDAVQSKGVGYLVNRFTRINGCCGHETPLSSWPPRAQVLRQTGKPMKGHKRPLPEDHLPITSHRAQWPAISCQRRAEVNGICSRGAKSDRPARARASATALTTAGVAPMVPNSPTPLTPKGLLVEGTL